jgi:hypothetical protein
MTNGVPPTAAKARTGEFTPPTSTFEPRRNAARDFAVRSLRLVSDKFLLQ